MKVIIIGPAHPLRGGLASFNERLAREFSSQGHDASIYTFSLQYPSFLFPGTTQYSTEPAPTDIKIKVAINSVNPLNWIKAGLQLKKAKADIIVVRYWLPFMGPCLGTILRLVKSNKQTKVICIADNIIPHEKRLGDTSFTKYFLPSVDAFVTMSEKVLADVQALTKKPVEMVAHPLYDNFGEKIPLVTARKILGLAETDFVLLFFGFIRKYKGLDLLLEAMPKIIEKIPHVKLVIAGEFYDDKKNYSGLLNNQAIIPNLLVHTDFIPDSRVKDFFCAADLVVQPYRNATQSGVTPLAYHFEVPMVVTNVGGLPAMVTNGEVGFVAKPNADSIASQIIRFYETKDIDFVSNIQKEKKKYSWSVLTNTIFKLAKF